MGRDLDCMADVADGVPPIHFFQAEHTIQFKRGISWLNYQFLQKDSAPWSLSVSQPKSKDLIALSQHKERKV